LHGKPNLGTLAFAAIFGLGLAGCQPGFRILHHLHVAKTGFSLDGKAIDSATAADTLRPFCSDHETRHMWKLDADSNLTSGDFVGFLSWISKVNPDCRGLFALNDEDPPVLLQPPIPAPRTLYSFSSVDSLKPRLSLMVVANRQEVKFWTDGEWLPEIPVVRDRNTGMEYAASGKAGLPALMGWHDDMGRCLVEVRQDRCTDTLWPKTKYVLLGNLSRLPDTVDPASKKDMEWVARGPIRRDVAVAAEIHAYRTIPGAIPDNRPYYHAVLAPNLTWESTIGLLIALRRAGVDLNTVEIL
jgi:hypothetical protein